MKQKPHYGSCRQQGIALPIIMIILVLAALVTIYTTTTSVKEQQVTADQYRSEQAFAAAQAGVDDGLKRHNDYPELDIDGNPVGDDELDMPSVPSFSMGSYNVMFCDIWDEGDDPLADGDAAPDTDDDNDGHTTVSLMADFLADTVECTNPINPADSDNTDSDGFEGDRRVGILSVGKPDDASGRRTISVVSAPAFTIDRDDGVFPPLSARGNSGITGNITVFNRYKNLTLWLGADLDFGSAAVSTFINDGTLEPDFDVYGGTLSADEHRLAMMDPLTGPALENAELASDIQVGQNSDALTGDINLKDMTEEELFEGVFLRKINVVKDMAIAAGQYFTDVGVLQEETRTGLIWLEVSDDVSLNNPIGTFDESAFLVVEFSDRTKILTVTANAIIYGAVFTFGQVSLKGGPVIYGALVATGSVVGGAGGGTIVYDPESLETDPEGLMGLRGIEPGTWKDWGYVN